VTAIPQRTAVSISDHGVAEASVPTSEPGPVRDTIGPAASGCVSGNAPLAHVVVTTGILAASTKRINASTALDEWTPAPAITNGLSRLLLTWLRFGPPLR
jgi:hypothetical protein